MSDHPFIFISYAHKDSDIVLPCIEAMRRSNINFWYDNGIQAGSEWPEFVASKVIDCDKFILFVSNSYLESQNCKREINFAISRKKDILSVFIEDVKLSPGMEMQLGPYQSIFMNRFESTEVFQNSLCQEHWFDHCRGYSDESDTCTDCAHTDNTEIPISDTSDAVKSTNESVSPSPLRRIFLGGNNDFSGLVNLVKEQALDEVFSTAHQLGFAKNKRKEADSRHLTKKKNIAALLAIFLGSFGIHRFYLGKPVSGLLFLVFFWSFVPLALGIIEGIIMMLVSDEKFEGLYRCKAAR